MQNLKFRVLNPDGKFEYAEGSQLSGLFYGIDDGQVDGETLGQFTGLKDKNGKEIYSGDIVTGKQCKDYAGNWVLTDSGKVGFKYSGFAILDKDNKFVNMLPIYHQTDEDQEFSDSEIEVIGNIYQSPELLD